MEWTNITSMCYFGDRFYAVVSVEDPYGNISASGLASSLDGVDWTKIDLPLGGWGSTIAANEEGILLCGSVSGEYYWSEDGLEWEPLDSAIRFAAAIRPAGEWFYFQSMDYLSTLWRWSPSAGLFEMPVGVNERRTPGFGASAHSASVNFVVSYEGQVYAGDDLLDMESTYVPICASDILVGDDVVVAFSPYAIAAAALDRTDYIWNRGARYLNGWVESAWYGWLFDGTFPFTYHAQQGWQYQVIDPQGNIAYWDYALGKWAWTNRNYYPYLYVWDGPEGGWVYYEPESSTPNRWFYDFNGEDWVQEIDFAVAD